MKNTKLKESPESEKVEAHSSVSKNIVNDQSELFIHICEGITYQTLYNQYTNRQQQQQTNCNKSSQVNGINKHNLKMSQGNKRKEAFPSFINKE